jgi:hypothetical protein
MEKGIKKVESNVYDVLTLIQNELKAPKNQRNKFGNYNYRSCEDIMEALKPILLRHNAGCKLSDKIIIIGTPEVLFDPEGKILKESGRVYIEATCTFTYGNEMIETTASAREEYQKKGMDSMQLTGATSSYARKYSLNAMFLIDDSKDSDATNTHGKYEEPKKNVIQIPKVTALSDQNIDHAIEQGIQEKVLNLIGSKYSANESQISKLKESLNK